MPTLHEEPETVEAAVPLLASARRVEADPPRAVSRWTLRLSTGACFGIALLVALAGGAILVNDGPFRLGAAVTSVGGALFAVTVAIATVRALRALAGWWSDENGFGPVVGNLALGARRGLVRAHHDLRLHARPPAAPLRTGVVAASAARRGLDERVS
jgi:hypothetical protein